MTEKSKRKLSRSCLASARRRRRIGLKPGCANDPLVEAKRRQRISKARKGVKFTKEHCRKLALAHIGVTPRWKDPVARGGKISLAQKGKPVSRKKLLAIRRSGKARRLNRPKIPHTVERRFRELRIFVLVRDGNTCKGCGETEHIVVHHIDHEHGHNWLNNLVAACRGCNRRAELPFWKAHLEKKFKKYISTIVYQLEVA